MLSFKIEKDKKNNRDVIEVWDGDTFVACIYFHEENIIIVSKFLDDVLINRNYLPALIVIFNHRRIMGYGS